MVSFYEPDIIVTDSERHQTDPPTRIGLERVVSLPGWCETHDGRSRGLGLAVTPEIADLEDVIGLEGSVQFEKSPATVRISCVGVAEDESGERTVSTDKWSY